jgi:hypothetical protein
MVHWGLSRQKQTNKRTLILLAPRYKVAVCSRSPSEIVGSNPAGCMDVFVSVLCCQVERVGLITRPEESYHLWCVVVCDLETSRNRRQFPALGRNATWGGGIKGILLMHIYEVGRILYFCAH